MKYLRILSGIVFLLFFVLFLIGASSDNLLSISNLTKDNILVLIKILLPIILLGAAYTIARIGYLWTVVTTLAVTILNIGIYFVFITRWFFFIWTVIGRWLAFSPYTSVFFGDHYNLYIGILQIFLYIPFIMSVAITAFLGIRWGFRRDRARRI